MLSMTSPIFFQGTFANLFYSKHTLVAIGKNNTLLIC